MATIPDDVYIAPPSATPPGDPYRDPGTGAVISNELNYQTPAGWGTSSWQNPEMIHFGGGGGGGGVQPAPVQRTGGGRPVAQQNISVGASPGDYAKIIGDVLGAALGSLGRGLGWLGSWNIPGYSTNPFGAGAPKSLADTLAEEERRRKGMPGAGTPIGVTPATHITPAPAVRENPLTRQPFTQTPGGAADSLARYQQARQNLEQLKGRPITAAEDAELLNLANQSRPGIPAITPEAPPQGGGQPGQPGQPGVRWGDVNTISRSLANWNITEAQAWAMANANLPPGMDINTFWKSILDRVSQMRHGGGGRSSGYGGGGGGGGGGGAPAVTPPPAPGGEPNISPIQPDTTGHFVIPDWYFTNMPQASIDVVVAWLRNHGYQPMTMGRFAPSEWAGAPGQIFTDVNSLPDDPYVRWLFYRMGWTSASAYPEVTA